MNTNITNEYGDTETSHSYCHACGAITWHQQKHIQWHLSFEKETAND